jgi:cation diffusion facilitator CzcD-associated flavoprotein CzcO
MNETVIVVGGGPAGLAVAAELRRARIPAVVLEQADTVGASWRDRYDRLRLNSSRPFSRLPRAAYARGTGIFPSRDEVHGYLRGFAARNELDVRLGVSVDRIERDGDRWCVRTSAGDMHAAHVVVATGKARRGHIPAWKGRDAYVGPLIHAIDYRSPDAYRGRDVLVVGAGCSGAEIAYDLAEGGARRVRLAARTAPNMMLRAPIGPPLAMALYHLPLRWSDAIARFARRRTIGDLSEYGLPIPEEGVFSRLRRLGVAPTIVDPEVIQAIREYRIEIVPGVEQLDVEIVQLADGTRIAPDAVICATGYGTGLDPVVGHLGVLNEKGAPRVVDGEAAPGLRFVGYITRPAQLGHLGSEARTAARAIAREARRAPARRRREAVLAVTS